MRAGPSPWLIAAALIIAAGVFHVFGPARHNPFGAIDLAAKPGLGTFHHLTRLKKNKELCFAKLSAADVGFAALPDQSIGARCTLKDAGLLQRTLTPYSAELKMTCAEAAALYTWERHVARPAAEAILGAKIIRIETYGSFSCRSIKGTERLSEHGHGNAIDIWGFKLEDGRTIDVKSHWKGKSKEAAFLRKVHQGGCGLFSVTLGPDYNADHADHFHFDMGAGRACR